MIHLIKYLIMYLLTLQALHTLKHAMQIKNYTRIAHSYRREMQKCLCLIAKAKQEWHYFIVGNVIKPAPWTAEWTVWQKHKAIANRITKYNLHIWLV